MPLPLRLGRKVSASPLHAGRCLSLPVDFLAGLLRGRATFIPNYMKLFLGTVTTGYGMATPNLHPVMSLIEERIGLSRLIRGTLNVIIPEEYIVAADALILPDEYPYNKKSGLRETIKLQRCLIAGHPGIIVRPDSHEFGSGQFHGKAYLELMGQIHFRSVLHLTDGSTLEIQIADRHPGG